MATVAIMPLFAQAAEPEVEADIESITIIPTIDNDSNDQISEAGTLGVIDRTRTSSGLLDTSTDVDLFSFTVTAGQRISFDALTGASGSDRFTEGTLPAN